MRKKLFLYFLAEFFGSLAFGRGIFILLLLDRGLSMGAVGVLQTLLFVSNLVFEIPAGLFADRLKRKYSISAGYVLAGLSAFMMPYAQKFSLFAVAFILYGMGFALRSGADKALLFDELKAAGPEWAQKYLSLSAWARGLVNIGLVLAMGVGGFMKDGLGWYFVYALYGAAMIAAALFAISIDEGKHEEVHQERSQGYQDGQVGLIAHIKIFLSSVEGRSLLLFVCGLGFIEAMHAPFFIYFQVYLKDGGLSEGYVSLFISLSLAVTSIGYLMVNKFKDVSFPKLVLGTSALLTVLVSSFLLQPPVWIGVILFALIELIPSLLFVHSDNYINLQLPTAIRASLLSICSLINSIFISLAFLAGGGLMDYFSSANVLGALFVLPLLSGTALYFFFSKARIQAKELGTT